MLEKEVTHYSSCPFLNVEIVELDCYADTIESCKLNDGGDCDPKLCRLKEEGSITVYWKGD